MIKSRGFPLGFCFFLPRPPCVRGSRIFNTHAPNKSVRSVRRHSPPCRAFALCFLSQPPCVRGPRGISYSLRSGGDTHRRGERHTVVILPHPPCVRGPRIFNTHAPNKSVRSVRRHSPPCRAFALCFLPQPPCVRGPRGILYSLRSGGDTHRRVERHTVVPYGCVY